MATAAESQGLSPGFKFNPSVEQLLRFFLLPYLQHQHLLVDGIVFVDDPASAPPWALLHRHGRGSEDEAYFIGPATAGDGQGGRRGQQQVSRTVTGGGGGKWIKQRTEHSGKGKRVLFSGETFGWEEFSLNFHADDRCRSGSTGWVMHEFAVVPPRGSRVAATHTACHIAFTGHGQKRKRVPDGYVFVDVQTAAADVPPPSPMLCSSGEPLYSGASHDEHFSDEPPPPPYANTQEHQRFLPAAEQSDQEQEYCLPEQQNYQDYYVAAAEQSDQDYFYQGMINQEQGCNQQDYAYQQQQHLFHGDPLATSQQFLDQDREVLFIGHGSGLVVSDNGEPAAAPATEPPVHCVFLEPLMREPPENVYVDGAGESAMASAGSTGGAPLQQALATPQQFLDQEQAQAPAPAGLNDGGAVISNNNGDGEHAAAPAAQPPARYYNGPVPAVDSVFLDKMREYLMADAKGLCRIPVEDAPTNGDHAVAPVPAVDEPLAAQQGSAPPPPVPPDTAELERVVGHLLMEVEKIIKVAAAGGYGGSSDKPLSNFDKAQNHILAKLMAVFNQVAES